MAPALTKVAAEIRRQRRERGRPERAPLTDKEIAAVEALVLPSPSGAGGAAFAGAVETFVMSESVLEWGEPAPQNQPTSTPVWEAVIADMQSRDHFGRSKYGVPLATNNGRKALKDLYEELLDAAVYCKQLLLEMEGK